MKLAMAAAAALSSMGAACPSAVAPRSPGGGIIDGRGNGGGVGGRVDGGDGGLHSEPTRPGGLGMISSRPRTTIWLPAAANGLCEYFVYCDVRRMISRSANGMRMCCNTTA